MDNEKLIEFLREMSQQLGASGEQAFRVVGQRVIAESIVWLVVGSLALIISLIAGTYFIRSGRKEGYDSDRELSYILGAVIFGIGVLIGGAAIIPSAINLMGVEYATVERILMLVGNAT